MIKNCSEVQLVLKSRRISEHFGERRNICSSSQSNWFSLSVDDLHRLSKGIDSPFEEKHSLSFFVFLLKTRSSPVFPPTSINWLPQRKPGSVFRLLHQEQTSPINFYVGGLRCFKSRKPEDRLGCHRLWEIACGASIGH